MRILYFTNKGNVSLKNEDSLCIYNKNKELIITEENNINSIIYSDLPLLCVVADGLGGHTSGADASRIVCEKFIENFKKNIMLLCEVKEINTLINNIFDEINICLLKLSESNNGYKNLGSTIAGVFIDEKKNITIFNAGDSRIYFYFKKNLIQLTKDHITENYVSFQDIKRLDLDPKGIINCAGGWISEKFIDIKNLSLISEKNFYICIFTDGITNFINKSKLLEILNNNELEEIYNMIDIELGKIEKNDNYSGIIIDFEGE